MPEFAWKDVTETPYFHVTESCSMDPADLSAAMGQAFGVVQDWMKASGVDAAGPALAVCRGYDPERMTFRAGYLVAREDLEEAAVTPADRVLHSTDEGPYATLRDDYGLLMRRDRDRRTDMGRSM